MSIERALFAFGGVMVMITSLLALFHNPLWTWFTLFIGFNCLQSSFTGQASWPGSCFALLSDAQRLAVDSGSR